MVRVSSESLLSMVILKTEWDLLLFSFTAVAPVFLASWPTLKCSNTSSSHATTDSFSPATPTCNLYPTLPQELSRIRNISQNENTVEINRQIIHPRRNRNFQTPRVHFDIPQSPSPSTPENPISILPETPTLLSQRSTSSIPSDYLGSTPTSEQIRENPFNPPNQTSRLPYWTTQSFTQGEPNLINDPIDISTDTTTSSSLPETLSLPSTPSISQISPTPFPLNFPNNLDARYREQSSTNIPLRLD